MSRTQDYTETIHVVACPSCGVTYGLTASYRNHRREDHKSWWCPNGHSVHFRAENETEKLRNEVERLKRQKEWAETSRRAALDQAETAEYRRRVAVGANTKLKKRIANGVCPCCKRSFADLHRHMAGQHPDFAAPAGGS